MKIYTKTGDDGTSGNLLGERRKKDDLLFAVLGDLDELNACVGLVAGAQDLDARTLEIQSYIFDLGAEVASLSRDVRFVANDIEGEITQLEKDIDDMVAQLPELTNFILPGGSMASQYAHLARAVCRRLERSMVALLSEESNSLRPEVVQWVNRFSDWLFTLARFENYSRGIEDPIWTKK